MKIAVLKIVLKIVLKVEVVPEIVLKEVVPGRFQISLLQPV